MHLLWRERVLLSQSPCSIIFIHSDGWSGINSLEPTGFQLFIWKSILEMPTNKIPTRSSKPSICYQHKSWFDPPSKFCQLSTNNMGWSYTSFFFVMDFSIYLWLLKILKENTDKKKRFLKLINDFFSHHFSSLFNLKLNDEVFVWTTLFLSWIFITICNRWADFLTYNFTSFQ